MSPKPLLKEVILEHGDRKYVKRAAANVPQKIQMAVTSFPTLVFCNQKWYQDAAMHWALKYLSKLKPNARKQVSRVSACGWRVEAHRNNVAVTNSCRWFGAYSEDTGSFRCEIKRAARIRTTHSPLSGKLGPVPVTIPKYMPFQTPSP